MFEPRETATPIHAQISYALSEGVKSLRYTRACLKRVITIEKKLVLVNK